MEDPLYPWVQTTDASVAEQWASLRSRYSEETRRRIAFNHENFRPFGDLAQDGFGGWHADGSLSDGPSPSGEFAVANTGPRAITGLFPACIYTHALSELLH